MSTLTVIRRPRFVAVAVATAALAAASLAGSAQPAQAAGCAHADDAVVHTPGSGPEFPAQDNRVAVRTAMVCLINDQRALAHVTPLVITSQLTKGAQTVASSVKGNSISFAGADNRMKAYCAGAGSCTFYEYGIVIVNGTARHAVDTLLASADVKKVLLAPALTEIGGGAEATWWGDTFASYRTGGAFGLELGRRA